MFAVHDSGLPLCDGLTRRELASYFFSPIGYLVLGGMAVCEWQGYMDLINTLSSIRSPQEPIVRFYFVAILPVFGILVEVPGLTMRLMAEERRSGTLEVLLTAPVSEASIIRPASIHGAWNPAVNASRPNTAGYTGIPACGVSHSSRAPCSSGYDATSRKLHRTISSATRLPAIVTRVMLALQSRQYDSASPISRWVGMSA